MAGSLEQELLALAKRQQAGTKLLPNKQLRTAALKVRDEQLALERAAALRAEQERMAQARAEEERIARLKAEAERREQERLAAIKAARDAIKFTLKSGETIAPLAVGTAVLIPFRLINSGKDTEEFSVTAQLPAGLNGQVVQGNDITQVVSKFVINAGQYADLQLSFTVPPERVDGSHLVVAVQAASTKFTDISQTHEMPLTVTAPLLRAVARLQTSVPKPGDSLPYKVTVLNVGSRQADAVELHISLPPQLQLVETDAEGCRIEDEQRTVCRIAALPAGQMIERLLRVIVRQDTQETAARGVVDVLQTTLQLKESFSGAAFTVKRP